MSLRAAARQRGNPVRWCHRGPVGAAIRPPAWLWQPRQVFRVIPSLRSGQRLSASEESFALSRVDPSLKFTLQ